MARAVGCGACARSRWRGLFAVAVGTSVSCPRRQLNAIAVVPKGTTHEFWKSVHAGARSAGEELRVQILWKGPLREDDREQQIQVVETFANMNVLRHRAGAARQQGAGAGGARRRRPAHPAGDLRLGPGERRQAQLRRHRQLPGRAARAASTWASCSPARQRARRDAALSGRIGQHQSSASRVFSTRSRRFPTHQGRVEQSIRRRDDRERVQGQRKPARRADHRRGRDAAGHLLPQRVDRVRHAARAGGPSARGQGPLHRLRHLGQARRGAAPGPHGRAPSCRTRCRWATWR